MLEHPTSADTYRSPELRQQLTPNIRCLWSEKNPQHWHGYTFEQLRDITLDVAQFLRIPPRFAEIIQLDFADHSYYKDIEGISPGSCYIFSDLRTGVITRCEVVINRSREVAYYSAGRDKGSISETANTKQAFVRINSLSDFLIFALAEELAHAKVALKLRTIPNTEQACWRYQEFLKSRKTLAGHHYSLDLEEVAAGRQALRALIHFTSDLDRKPKLQSLYQRCLENSIVATPLYDPNVLEEIFIPTGPKSEFLRQSWSPPLD